MAEIVFPCSCGMLLKVHGVDQVGQGIVCPSCGGTAIVPAVGIAVDPEAPLFSDDPPSPPAVSKGGKWFGLVYLAGMSAVTLGLIKFVLMPALATPPITVAQADHPDDDKPEADDAPRRLLTKPPGRTTTERTKPAASAATPKARVKPKSGARLPTFKSAGAGGPPGMIPRGAAGGVGDVPDPGAVPVSAPAAPRDRMTTPEATPKTDDAPVPSKPGPRPGALASETGGPANARRVSKSTKTADKPAAKKLNKGQDPVARVKTLMNLAFNLEVQQNYEGALEYYREITTKYPDAPQAKTAADRVRALTAK